RTGGRRPVRGTERRRRLLRRAVDRASAAHRAVGVRRRQLPGAGARPPRRGGRCAAPALGEVLRDQPVTVTEASTQLLTSRGLLALAVALGTATTAAAFLIDALTLAYREAETRPLLHRTGLALAFVLGGAVVVGTVIAGTAQVSRALAGAPGWLRTLALAAAWVVLAALMALALAVLYRFAPDRHGRAKWRWVSGGAAVTTLLWLAVSAGLFAYVQRLGTYERMYGSLAGVAISMLWL